MTVELAKAWVVSGALSESIENLIKEYMRREDLLTFSISQHPIDDGTDFTSMKLIYDHSLEPLDLTANADVSLNNDPGAGPNAGKEQDVLRDYGASVALSYKLERNPFATLSENPRPIEI